MIDDANEPFPLRNGDTDRSPHPPEDEMPDDSESHTPTAPPPATATHENAAALQSLDELAKDLDRLEAQMRTDAEELKNSVNRALEQHESTTKQHTHDLMNLVLKRFAEGDRRFERLEKAVRMLNTETDDARIARGLERSKMLVDITP